MTRSILFLCVLLYSSRAVSTTPVNPSRLVTSSYSFASCTCVRLFVCLFCLFVCMFVCLLVCLFVFACSVCECVCLFAFLFACLIVCVCLFYLFVCECVCLFAYCLCVCVCVTYSVGVHVVSKEERSHVIVSDPPSRAGQVFEQTVEILLEMLFHCTLRQGERGCVCESERETN